MLSKRQKLSHDEGYALTLQEKWDVKALNDILSRRSALLRNDGEVDQRIFEADADLQSSDSGGNT